jgi:hypothetical protein
MRDETIEIRIPQNEFENGLPTIGKAVTVVTMDGLIISHS